MIREIERLNWDSTFFGYEVGRLNISSIKEFNFSILRSQLKRFKLVYIYSDIKLSVSTDLKLVDEKVTFYQRIATNNLEPQKPLNFSICNFDNRKHDFFELRNLALESGIYSRFSIDSDFKNNEYEKDHQY